MNLRGLIACILVGTQCLAIAVEQGGALNRVGLNPLIVTGESAETSLEVPGVPSLYFIAVTRTDKAGQLASTTRGVGFSYDRVGPECILLTAAHVIKDASEVNAYLWNADLNAGAGFEASVKWVDEEKDLAALGIKDSNACTPVRHNDDKVPIGRRVYAYLNAPILRGMVTTGMVTTGMVSSFWNTELGPMIVCDMAVHPGQSGSPLLDAQGLLIGMVVSRIQSGEMLGAFALPAKSIKAEFQTRQRSSEATTASKYRIYPP